MIMLRPWAGIVCIGLLTACGGGKALPGAATSTPGIKAAGAASVGDKTLCPVSKEEFIVTSTSPKVEYKGKTYYFCCPGCDTKFKEDPEKYLNDAT